jgi:pyruvate kinase
MDPAPPLAPRPGKPVPEHSRAFTKIVATIGPASEDRLVELIRAGMSVARINFSHGTLVDHARRIQKIRAAAQAEMCTVGILADLPGPKMRCSSFPGGSVLLLPGTCVEVRSGVGEAPPGEVWLEVEDLLDAVRPGHRIVLADGQVELLAEAVSRASILARVRRGGPVGNRKGVHLPDSVVRYELPTAEDRQLIAFAREQNLDMLGISFVGRASEVRTIRELYPDALLVAKIERHAALENLAELLEASDGIMVARGDLGVELELEQLPLTQKALLSAALHAGRFTITATEMLESMISSSRPTRAEVTDVANAVLDGTDAVMLSAETAVGEFPVEAVATMTRIARAVETSQRYHDLPRLGFRPSEANFSNAVAMAAAHVAQAIGIRHIVCFTETGNTVRQLSRYRPQAEIVALSPHLKTVRHMSVLANVRPILFRREPSLRTCSTPRRRCWSRGGWRTTGTRSSSSPACPRESRAART